MPVTLWIAASRFAVLAMTGPILSLRAPLGARQSSNVELTLWIASSHFAALAMT
jgi:hypothetical protein